MHPSVQDPRRLVLPEHLQIFVVRVPRDEKRIAELELAAVQLNPEIDELAERLRTGKKSYVSTAPKESNLIATAIANAGLTNQDLPVWARRKQ
jgi:hypothetical protein